MQSLERLRPSPVDCIGTVLSSIQLTPTIKAIRLLLDEPVFDFLPGQSIWPWFEREGRSFQKIYSIASSPEECPEVELCVSRVGWSSAYLQDLQVGQTIAARGPYGLMTLSQLPRRPRLYIAEGSGIAPLKSQIDWLYHTGDRLPVWLVQSNPETPDQLPYQSYWRSLAQSWAAFHYVEGVNQTPEQILRTLPIDFSVFEIDICGVDNRPCEIATTVLTLGAKADQIRYEKFFAF